MYPPIKMVNVGAANYSVTGYCGLWRRVKGYGEALASWARPVGRQPRELHPVHRVG